MSLLQRLLLLLVLALALPAQGAASGKVIKVLPQLLDLEGRHALSPSLYDRDAYQAELRAHPEKQSGMRFATHWKATSGATLKLRIELRGSHLGRATKALIEETVRHKGWFGSWSHPAIRGDAFRQLGELTAWRASLWDGEILVAEQKSFLW